MIIHFRFSRERVYLEDGSRIPLGGIAKYKWHEGLVFLLTSPILFIRALYTFYQYGPIDYLDPTIVVPTGASIWPKLQRQL